jgi:enamine deaminase RidA (YjgF/YER057c/UK114 family)
MTEIRNPYAGDADREAIWDMLVRRDIDAFVAGDWSMVDDDFVGGYFFGLDAGGSHDPRRWNLAFPDLATYRETWLRQAADLGTGSPAARTALLDASTVDSIDIEGTRAIARKRIEGEVTDAGGTRRKLRWQTLYVCERQAGRWRIVSFVGYLPLQPEGVPRAKRAAARARQHAGAGPYSPALEVLAGTVVVISGQAAIDPTGSVIGESIEEQAELTLRNCQRQLESLGYGLDDVFKVNVYMRDMADWHRFNTVYEHLFEEPRPVRTAVGAQLLPGLLVEVEMWGARP